MEKAFEWLEAVLQDRTNCLGHDFLYIIIMSHFSDALVESSAKNFLIIDLATRDYLDEFLKIDPVNFVVLGNIINIENHYRNNFFSQFNLDSLTNSELDKPKSNIYKINVDSSKLNKIILSQKKESCEISFQQLMATAVIAFKEKNYLLLLKSLKIINIFYWMHEDNIVYKSLINNLNLLVDIDGSYGLNQYVFAEKRLNAHLKIRNTCEWVLFNNIRRDNFAKYYRY